MKKCLYMLLAAALILLPTGCGSEDPQETPAPTLTATEGEETLKVYFLDVGKGDSALISIPGGHWAMIDTGPKNGFREIGRQLFQNNIEKLSALILSHGHKDHIGGLEYVLSMADCEKIFTNGDAMNEKSIIQAAASGTPVNLLKAGDVVNIGEAVFTVLGPVGSYAEENDNSLVIMLEYKDTKLLFTGDQQYEAESDILSLGDKLKADVLKVAHHGQDDTSSARFIKAVSPVYAVITTDLENPPSQQVLNSISIAGGQSFVLGETGTMLFETDGKSYKMSPLPVPDGAVPDVRVEAFDVSAEFVKIANHTGSTVDISGWCIHSEKGGEAFFFPKGTELKSGESISVLSGDAAQAQAADIVWTTDKVWSKKDICVLYDSYGREASRS